jgi:hypothetical protein
MGAESGTPVFRYASKTRSFYSDAGCTAGQNKTNAGLHAGCARINRTQQSNAAPRWVTSAAWGFVPQ